jgi:hypothetical protein
MFKGIKMKKFVTCLSVMVVSVGLMGCGGSGEPSSVVDNAEQSAVEAYEQALAEEEAAMSADFNEEQ